MISRKNIWFWVMIMVFLACRRQEKTTEVREIHPGVELPDTKSNPSIVVMAADTDAVTRLLTFSMIRKLGYQGIRAVASHDAVSADSGHIMTAIISHEQNRLKIIYNKKSLRTDSTWTENVIYQEESMFLAAESVARHVGGNKDKRMRTDSAGPVSKPVFERFIRAEFLRNRATQADLNEAVHEFKAVLKTDSLFSDAWLGLAECYLSLIEKGWERNPVWLKLAEQSGWKLMSLCAECGDAECVFGRIAWLRGDLQGAEDHFRKAIRQNPNLVCAWNGLGTLFARFGFYPEALDMYSQALELDPVHLHAGTGKALILSGLGDYGQSVQVLEKLIPAHPEARYLYSLLALQFYYQNRLDQAMQSVQEGLKDSELQPLSHAILAMIMAKQENWDAALGEIELEVKPQAEGNASLAVAVAAVYTLLGRKGEAVQWLGHAVDQGYQEYPWLVNDPNFITLKGDERYQAICDTMKSAYEARHRAYWMNNPS